MLLQNVACALLIEFVYRLGSAATNLGTTVYRLMNWSCSVGDGDVSRRDCFSAADCLQVNRGSRQCVLIRAAAVSEWTRGALLLCLPAQAVRFA